MAESATSASFRSGPSSAQTGQQILDTFTIANAGPYDGGTVTFTDALPAISDDYMEETTTRRTWGGDGEFELDRFATTLLDRGWDGVVSVEVISSELRQLPVADYAKQAYATTAPYWKR